MSMKNIRNLVLGLTVLVLFGAVCFRVGQISSKESVMVMNNGKLDLSLMWKVKDVLGKDYLDKSKLDEKKMVYGAIEGMVESLDDPYTMFLPPQENKSSNEDLAGKFGGVGIQLGYKDKNLAVMSPLAKTPADIAGVKAGDLILKIIDKNNNIDKDTYGITLDEAVKLIRGEVGTEVTLRMFREGKNEPFDVVLKRDNIIVPSLEIEWTEKKGKQIAWVKLYKFSEMLNTDWNETVDKILAKKKEVGSNYGGIVLDLRNNPGGYLNASVMVGSEFLNEGVIVKQESAKGIDFVYEVDKNRRKLLDDKLVVLINGGSASASEILSGALRDHKRAILVGEKSFGKGTVQEPKEFSDGSGIHITIAKWLLPAGNNIHKEGITPDVEVKQNPESKEDDQLNKAIDELLK